MPLSNMLLVFSFPASGIDQTLLVYSLTSAVCSVLAIYLFSKYNLNRNISIGILSIPIIIIPFYSLNDNIFLLCCVACLVYQQAFFDYWSTQFQIKHLALSRLLFLLITALLILCVNDLLYFVIARQALILGYAAQTDTKSISQKLKLKHTSGYICGTHIIYYGHLSLVPFVTSVDFAKFVFVIFQLSHQVILKLLDFTIRSAYELNISLLYVVIFVITILILSLLVFIMFFGNHITLAILTLCVALSLYLPVVKSSSNASFAAK